MITRQALDNYAAAFPSVLKDQSFYEVWQNPDWRKLYLDWSENHPLAGLRVKLASRIPRASRNGGLTQLLSLRCGRMEICGDSWRIVGHHAKGRCYWLAPDKIDWSALRIKERRSA